MRWNGVTGNREYGEEEKDDIRFSRCTECDNSDGACFGGRSGDICEEALERVEVDSQRKRGKKSRD